NLQAQYEAQYGPGNYIPPVAVTYWTFRIMVGAGFAMMALALYALFMVMGDFFETRTVVLRIFLFAMALPYLANTAGWLMTELGRAPWVVFGLMKIEDAVSPTVSGGMVLTTLVIFTLVYGVLMAADIYLLTKFAKQGVKPTAEELPSDPGDTFPSLVGAQD